MPSCWFVLLRFWLRVDGVLVRLRETRVFCPFKQAAPGSPPGLGHVSKEVKHAEGSFEELAQAGAPSNNVSRQHDSAPVQWKGLILCMFRRVRHVGVKRSLGTVDVSERGKCERACVLSAVVVKSSSHGYSGAFTQSSSAPAMYH